MNDKKILVILYICISISCIILAALLFSLNKTRPQINVEYTPSTLETTGKNSYITERNEIPNILTHSKEENTEEQDKTNILIDINTAKIDEIMKIKGLGKKLADKIIEYRDENNGFKNTEDLKNVPGIGEKRYENIIKYIKPINGNSSPEKTKLQVSKNQQKNEPQKKCPFCDTILIPHKSRDIHYKPYCPNCLKYLND